MKTPLGVVCGDSENEADTEGLGEAERESAGLPLLRPLPLPVPLRRAEALPEVEPEEVRERLGEPDGVPQGEGERVFCKDVETELVPPPAKLCDGTPLPLRLGDPLSVPL